MASSASLIFAQVTGPTTASGAISISFWNSRTLAAVLGPKIPSVTRS